MTTIRRAAAVALCLAVVALSTRAPDDPATLMSSAPDYMARHSAARIPERNAFDAQPDSAAENHVPGKAEVAPLLSSL